jgi:hypothetical protein
VMMQGLIPAQCVQNLPRRSNTESSSRSNI